MSGDRQMSRIREGGAPTNSIGDDRAAFIARLQAIVRHWPSADRLARATGVSPSAFRKWLRGEAEPSRERLVSLAQAAGVTAGWLASGEGPEPRLQGRGKPARGREFVASLSDGLGGADYTLLPRRPEAAGAGPESPACPPDVEFIALRHDWVRSTLGLEPEHLALETAVGESMTPCIQDGDLLFLDTTKREFRSFGVYVLEIAGERLVKRVQAKLDGSLTLISDNSVYEPEHIPRERAAEVQVIGRVIWTCGPTRRFF